MTELNDQVIHDTLLEMNARGPFMRRDATARVIEKAWGSLGALAPNLASRIAAGVSEEVQRVLRRVDSDGVREWIHDCNGQQTKHFHRDNATDDELEVFADYLIKQKGPEVIAQGQRVRDYARRRREAA